MSTIFHDFGFHRVTFPGPRDLPCACGRFRDPVSSIGSAGSLVHLLRHNQCSYECQGFSYDNTALHLCCVGDHVCID